MAYIISDALNHYLFKHIARMSYPYHCLKLLEVLFYFVIFFLILFAFVLKTMIQPYRGLCNIVLKSTIYKTIL